MLCARLASLGFPLIFLISCNNSPENREVNQAKDSIPIKGATATQTVKGAFSNQQILHFDSALIGPFLKKYPLFEAYKNDIAAFYRGRRFAYAWFDNGGLIEQASNLQNHLSNLGAEGLPDRVKYRDSLSMILANAGEGPDPEIELMLSAQYFQYAEVAWGGLTEKHTRSIDWFLPRKQLDLPVLLDSLIKDSSFIAKGYSFKQYNLLKGYLKKYRALEAGNHFAELHGDQKSYKYSDSSSMIAAIRERLFAFGDLDKNSGSLLFDKELESGVRSYQARMGMNTDGVIGKTFLKSLNTPISNYITRIIVNMERSRWVPVNLAGDYFIVNIPAFELFAFEKDTIAFIMKVVVGKAIHKTVIFDGDLKYVVFSPYWNVPPDILKKEILPGIKKDPDYLVKHNMEWNGNMVRQKPGPKNSLGLVKFLFPNSFNIYLHDSPAKSLFNEDVRAFSHGCIRLAEPSKMAIYLLRDVPGWTPVKIEAAMKSGKEQFVTLQRPVPVYIAYLTAWVDRDGKLNLRDDIYKRDERLASMILKSGG